MTAWLIKADNLSCERDDRLLFNNLCFDLAAGELVQVTGPNGAGKSTLLRCLSGLFTDYEGSIQLQDELDQSAICYFGHKIPVKSNLTSIENLAYFSLFSQANDSVGFSEALDAVGMSGYEHVLCSDMSEGQKRRVALARVFLSSAPIILLDEPFASLDVFGVESLEKHLARFAQNGKLVVFTSHHHFSGSNVRTIGLRGANG